MNRSLHLSSLACLLSLSLVACDDKAKPDDKAPATSSSAPAKTASAKPATSASVTATATTTAMASAPPPASASAAPAASSAAAPTVSAAPTAAAAGGDTAEPTYAPYTDAKLGFALELPSTFTAQPDPKKAAEEMKWVWGTKGTLKASVLDAAGQSLAESFDSDSSRPGVTEKNKAADNYVLKGKNKGKVFYVKAYVVGGKISTIELQGDEGLKAQLDGVWTHVEKSFKPKGVK